MHLICTYKQLHVCVCMKTSSFQQCRHALLCKCHCPSTETCMYIACLFTWVCLCPRPRPTAALDTVLLAGSPGGSHLLEHPQAAAAAWQPLSRHRPAPHPPGAVSQTQVHGGIPAPQVAVPPHPGPHTTTIAATILRH